MFEREDDLSFLKCAQRLFRLLPIFMKRLEKVLLTREDKEMVNLQSASNVEIDISKRLKELLNTLIFKKLQFKRLLKQLSLDKFRDHFL